MTNFGLLLLSFSNKASPSNWPKVMSLESNMTYTYLSRMSFDLATMQFLKLRPVYKYFDAPKGGI